MQVVEVVILDGAAVAFVGFANELRVKAEVPVGAVLKLNVNVVVGAWHARDVRFDLGGADLNEVVQGRGSVQGILEGNA